MISASRTRALIARVYRDSAKFMSDHDRIVGCARHRVSKEALAGVDAQIATADPRGEDANLDVVGVVDRRFGTLLKTEAARPRLSCHGSRFD